MYMIWVLTCPFYTDVVKHQILTTDNIPIRQEDRSIPPAIIPEVKKMFKEWLKQGIVQKSSSSLQLAFAKKTDGKISVCFDYRQLKADKYHSGQFIPTRKISSVLSNWLNLNFIIHKSTHIYMQLYSYGQCLHHIFWKHLHICIVEYIPAQSPRLMKSLYKYFPQPRIILHCSIMMHVNYYARFTCIKLLQYWKFWLKQLTSTNWSYPLWLFHDRRLLVVISNLKIYPTTVNLC